MENNTLKDTAHITIVDLLEFKSAVVASSSVANARLLNFRIDGFTDLPSFNIEVDGVPRTAYISGTAKSENAYENAIIYYFEEHRGDDTCRYALAVPSDNGVDWIFSPNIVTDASNASPQFSELSISEQLRRLEV